MESWVDLDYPSMHRPGAELATSLSQGRRHTTTVPLAWLTGASRHSRILPTSWQTYMGAGAADVVFRDTAVIAHTQ